MVLTSIITAAPIMATSAPMSTTSPPASWYPWYSPPITPTGVIQSIIGLAIFIFASTVKTKAPGTPAPDTDATHRMRNRYARVDMDEFRITAVHEAAHAVAAIRAGLIFKHVTVIPDEYEETDGALHWSDLHASGDIEVSPRLLAVVLLAGPCAEARVTDREVDEVFADEEATDDREAIVELMLTAEDFVAASVEALALIERDWPLIERIADELMDVDELGYDEVEAMVVRAAS